MCTYINNNIYIGIDMAKLTYWCAPCLDDSSVYNIRTKTKKEAQAIIDSGVYGSNYGAIQKVEVRYKDAFDLVRMAMGEGSILEPS